jgi:hypothetical protein
LDAVLELGIVWEISSVILTDEVIEQATSVLDAQAMLNVILIEKN